MRLHLLTAVVTSILVGGVVAVSAVLASLGGSDGTGPPPGRQVPEPRVAPPAAAAAAPSPEAEEPSQPRLDLSVDVSVDIDGSLSWAALDRETGERTGSDNQADTTTTTESMIKVWLAADYLRRHSKGDREPSKDGLADARRAIRDSHNGAAERLYLDGGDNAAVERMIDMCGLTDTEVFPYYWSRTEISARDAVRLGECVADGTAAGEEWTEWLLEQMRKVRGTTDASDQPMAAGGDGGNWGIVDGLPPEVRERGVSIKNGWTALSRTGNWHVNCLAITDEWIMAVLMQYPANRSLDYGAQRCAGVAEQLVTVADTEQKLE